MWTKSELTTIRLPILTTGSLFVLIQDSEIRERKRRGNRYTDYDRRIIQIAASSCDIGK